MRKQHSYGILLLIKIKLEHTSFTFFFLLFPIPSLFYVNYATPCYRNKLQFLSRNLLNQVPMKHYEYLLNRDESEEELAYGPHVHLSSISLLHLHPQSLVLCLHRYPLLIVPHQYFPLQTLLFLLFISLFPFYRLLFQ